MRYDKGVSVISIIGGTGALGSGLALRWAIAGHKISIGSRDSVRAAKAAKALSLTAGAEISGQSNELAAHEGTIVVLAVPYSNHQATLEDIRPGLSGKILIDVTVPLIPPKVRTVQLPESGSVAKATQAFLGKDVHVVSAFQNVAAAHLLDAGHPIDCDVLVCGNEPEACNLVIELAADAGMRGWHAGRIDNSAVAEALTSALIFINGHYKIDGAGLRITGEPKANEAP
jgi:NADPH-dependent F420 reductase